MAETFTVAGHRFELDRKRVETACARELPEPLHEHFVVVVGRRFPPKQVIARVTGLDRADFTTHQARRILRRLGFVAGRTAKAEDDGPPPDPHAPHGGRQAGALRPYAGQWVALAGPCEVLVASPEPEQVLAWLARHDRVATGGMLRVPLAERDAEGAAPA